MLSPNRAVPLEGPDPFEPAFPHAARRRPAMVTRTFRALAALAGAALLSQFPAFYDQYLQRLGGRLDQARIEIARVEDAARREHLSVAAYIAVFLRDAQSPVRRHGRVMQTQMSEFAHLEAAFAALRDAPIATRPLRFAGNAASDIAGKTFEDFQPALPLGTEGLAYAFAGMLGGLLGARLGGRAVSAALRRRRPA